MHITIDLIQSWVQGAFIILIFYHLFSYYLSKDRSFVMYALYLIVLLMLSIKNTQNTFSIQLSEAYPLILKNRILVGLYQCSFIITYLWFTYYFLDLKNRYNKLAKIISKYNMIASIYCCVFLLLDLFIFKNELLIKLNVVFLFPCTLILLGYITIQITKTKTPLTTIYLVGLYVLVIFSMLSVYFYLMPATDFMLRNNINFSHFLMVGTFIEVVLMSIGLGIKEKVYLTDYEKNNYKLLKQLKQNEQLQEDINNRLQEKIEVQKQEIYLRNKEVENYKIAKVKTKYKNQVEKMKLTGLLSQMNPHFIFNALNSIKLFIINNDAKNAVFYLNKFSKLIRRILNSSTQNTTTLGEELDILEIYINLENIRFDNEINYSFKIDENLNSVFIPSLILQPFVENAIWHGLSTKEGVKNLDIIVKKCNETNSLDICIQDNGIGRKEAEKNKQKRRIKRKSIGIQITKERIKNFAQYRNGKHSISYNDLYENNEPVGTEVLLKIPLT